MEERGREWKKRAGKKEVRKGGGRGRCSMTGDSRHTIKVKPTVSSSGGAV